MVSLKLPAIKFDKPFTKVGSGVTNFEKITDRKTRNISNNKKSANLVLHKFFKTSTDQKITFPASSKNTSLIKHGTPVIVPLKLVILQR